MGISNIIFILVLVGSSIFFGYNVKKIIGNIRLG
ncbi:MAG: hypothetical protein ACI8ZM_005393, partial [Crocinitomix sp.]